MYPELNSLIKNADKIIKKFKYYTDSENRAFGILLENTDLNSFELNTNGSQYRIVNLT